MCIRIQGSWTTMPNTRRRVAPILSSPHAQSRKPFSSARHPHASSLSHATHHNQAFENPKHFILTTFDERREMASTAQMSVDRPKPPKLNIDEYLTTALAATPAELHPFFESFRTLHERKCVPAPPFLIAFRHTAARESSRCPWCGTLTPRRCVAGSGTS